MRQAEDEQLAKKWYVKALQNTDSEEFCNSDFNLPSEFLENAIYSYNLKKICGVFHNET